MAPSQFLPAALNEWRHLDETDRRLWLGHAAQRFFEGTFVPSSAPGRIVVLRGSLVDSRLGFFCAIGEAVNGPGGYFGKSMQAFDDCLFGGFGLEYPYTIVWKDPQRSRQILDSHALLRYLDEECNGDLTDEGRAWLDDARREALAGQRSLFEEIVDLVITVPERGGGKVVLTLDELGDFNRTRSPRTRRACQPRRN